MGNQISEEASGTGISPTSAVPEPKQQTSNAGQTEVNSISNLEKIAVDAERKLESLEKRVESLGGMSVGGNEAALTARYVEELKGLRQTLVEAEQEHQSLVEHVAELEKAKSKLEYQVLHLKRSLQSIS